MDYNTFETIIKTMENISERTSNLHDLGIDLMDHNDDFFHIISLFMLKHFGEIGKDWIDWYLYERPSLSSNEINKAWDENGKEICYDIPSLWKTVMDSDNA